MMIAMTSKRRFWTVCGELTSGVALADRAIRSSAREVYMLGFLWTILIGFVVGVIAKFVTPGSEYEPKGFILTTILGVAGGLTSGRQ